MTPSEKRHIILAFWKMLNIWNLSVLTLWIVKKDFSQDENFWNLIRLFFINNLHLLRTLLNIKEICCVVYQNIKQLFTMGTEGMMGKLNPYSKFKYKDRIFTKNGKRLQSGLLNYEFFKHHCSQFYELNKCVWKILSNHL